MIGDTADDSSEPTQQTQRPSDDDLADLGGGEAEVVGVLSPGTAFLEKPFSAAQLGQKLRELIDAKLVT